MSDTSKGNKSKKSGQRPSRGRKSKEPIQGSSNEPTPGTSQASRSAADRFAGGGAIRRTSNGGPSKERPSNGRPSNGRPSNERPSNGCPSNERPSNGHPSNERPSNGRSTSGSSDRGRENSEEKTKDPLSQRRPLDPDDDYYNKRQCNCEKEEPVPQSEYDVAGEWVTYTGEINQAVYQMASRSAAVDLQRQMRVFSNPGATPRRRQPVEPTPPPVSDRPDQPFEIIDEWAAFSAEEAALRAMDTARRAVDQAREAKRKANHAKLTGALHARLLEREARFAVQHARDMEAVAKNLVRDAERIAQLYAPSGEPAVRKLLFFKQINSHDVATYDSDDDIEAEFARALSERLAVRDASVNDEVPATKST